MVLALAGVAACASASTGRKPRDYNLISQNEITAANGTNAYDLITHLRPIFLKTRGRNSINNSSISNEYASVFLDGQFFGDINSLRNVSTLNVRDIRYLPASESVTRYGMQYGAGVIDIRTK